MDYRVRRHGVRPSRWRLWTPIISITWVCPASIRCSHHPASCRSERAEVLKDLRGSFHTLLAAVAFANGGHRQPLLGREAFGRQLLAVPEFVVEFVGFGSV